MMNFHHTNIVINNLRHGDARYHLAIVSNVSEAKCLEAMENAIDNEEMLPLTVVVSSGFAGDKLADLQGNEWEYAVGFDSTGEIYD